MVSWGPVPPVCRHTEHSLGGSWGSKTTQDLLAIYVTVPFILGEREWGSSIFKKPRDIYIGKEVKACWPMQIKWEYNEMYIGVSFMIHAVNRNKSQTNFRIIRLRIEIVRWLKEKWPFPFIVSHLCQQGMTIGNFVSAKACAVLWTTPGFCCGKPITVECSGGCGSGG